MTKTFKQLVESINKATDNEPLNELFNMPPISYQYHKTLNPMLWDENEMLKPEIRQKLIIITKAFLKYIYVDVKIRDVILRGSMASFNYNKKSDMDVHVIATTKDEMTKEVVEARRLLWKQKYPNITIMGIPVEMMIEEPDAKLTSAGIYSLKRNVWVRKPVHEKPTVDWNAVDVQAAAWIKDIKAAIASGDVKQITAVKKNIFSIRRGILDGTPGTEFSTENLAFKKIREKGYMDKMNKIIDDDKQQSLSMDKPK